jgi:multiple antibiotic resistance protein
MTFTEILIMLSVVAGATKAAAFFAANAGSLSLGGRRAVAFKAVAIQAVVLALFVAFGPQILDFFHVSIFALEIAGGLILLLFAIGLVLGESHDDSAAPTGDMAIYPLAVPLLASPQAIVAVTIFSTATAVGERDMIWAALAAILVANLIVMLIVAQVAGGAKTDGSGGGFAQVLLRVVALLLAALAVEIIVMGLRGYGVIAPMAKAAIGGH